MKSKHHLNLDARKKRYPWGCKVYVAGPFSINPARYTAFATDVGNLLWDLGYTPLVPHSITKVMADRERRDYNEWMVFTLSLLSMCDRMLRIPGHSPGSDAEELFAHKHDIPVDKSLWSLCHHTGFPDCDRMNNTSLDIDDRPHFHVRTLQQEIRTGEFKLDSIDAG